MSKMKLTATFSMLVLASITTSAFAQFSTPEQDAVALEAAKLTALGQYNYSAAAARREEEEARATAFDTSNRALREWYARKQLNADYVSSKNARTPGMLYRIAELKRPERLTLGQYSRQGRQLIWPDVLKDPLFEEERLALDELFAQRRAFDAGTDSEFYRSTLKLSKQMHQKLVEAIDQFNTSESISARKYLRSLEFEARILPSDLGGLAVSQP